MVSFKNPNPNKWHLGLGYEPNLLINDPNTRPKIKYSLFFIIIYKVARYVGMVLHQDVYMLIPPTLSTYPSNHCCNLKKKSLQSEISNLYNFFSLLLLSSRCSNSC